MSMFQPNPRPNPPGPRPNPPRPNPPKPPKPMPPKPKKEDKSSGGNFSPRFPQRGSGDGRMTAEPQMPRRERPNKQEVLDQLGLNRDGTSRNQMPRTQGVSDRLQRMADNLNAGRLVYYPPEIRQKMFDLGLIDERFLDTGPKPLPITPDTPRAPISINDAYLNSLLRRMN